MRHSARPPSRRPARKGARALFVALLSMALVSSGSPSLATGEPPVDVESLIQDAVDSEATLETSSAGEDAAPEDSSQDEAPAPDVIEAAPAEGESAEGDASEDEAVEGDAVEGDATEDEAAEAEASADEAAPSAEADTLEVGPLLVPPGDPAPNQAKIIVTAGGDRTGTGPGSSTTTLLAGATFEFFKTDAPDNLTDGTPTNQSCTTDGTGECGVFVALDPGINYFYAVQTGAPAGWGIAPAWSENTPFRFSTRPGINSTGTVADRTVRLPRELDATDPGGATAPDPVWANVRPNNAAPPQCGLDVAMVMDLSESVTEDPTVFVQYKQAATGFVNALRGTPSQLALYTFATSAPAEGQANATLPLTSLADPAGADAVISRISGLTPTVTLLEGATNWDRGFHQVAESGEEYDLVLFLTDGAPTNHRAGFGDGAETNIREVNEAILSANAVKATGAQVVLVGIGPDATLPGAAVRIPLVSGPTEGTDYFVTQFDDLAETLAGIAAQNCAGTLTVVKEIQDAAGAVSTAGEGWTFGTSTGGVTPTSAGTDATGAVNFAVTYPQDALTQSVSVTETQRPGYALVPATNGGNARCTTTATGAPIAVTNTDPLGFSVDVPATAAVTCTVRNRELAYQDLVVSKTATPAYAADYGWDITKEARQDRLEVPAGEDGTFTYDVTVTPTGPTYSGFVVSGVITVTNPNSDPVSNISVFDSTSGAICSVPYGTWNRTLNPGQTISLFYSCDIPGGTPTTAGTNTARVTWTAANYPGSSGVATAMAPYDFAAVTPSVTDGRVIVTDSEIDLATYDDGEQVGNVVSYADGETVFTYDITWPGVPGECQPYENTATIVNRDIARVAPGRFAPFALGGLTPLAVNDSSTETVEVCAGEDLEVAKNVIHSFERTYLWDIDKEVDRTEVTVGPDGTAEFTYTVTATPLDFTDSGWAMSGSITVTNANTWLDITADVTDEVDVGGGAVCTVAGGEDVVVARGTSTTLLYSCTFATQPGYTGTNTATVTWADDVPTPTSSASGTAAVTAAAWAQTPVNQTVQVMDDKTDPANPVLLGNATWNAAGTPIPFTYTSPTPVTGVPGTCVELTNRAWIAQTGQDDTAAVEICEEAPPVVTKTAEATFDRTYEWDIEKYVDRTLVTVDEATGEATFTYTVYAVPSGSTDDGWELSGEITVENPNDFAPLTVTVTDVVDVGGGAVCTVDGGVDVEIAAGTTATFDYDCTFTPGEDPELEGVNTATVAWTDADGGARTTTATTDVIFEIDTETDYEVIVWDDQTDPDNPVEIGDAEWNDKGTSDPITYTKVLEGVPGTCVDFTNTAWVEITDGDNPTDEQIVTVCVTSPVTVTKTAEASLDRTYLWDVEKSVDRTTVTVDAATGEADFVYTVTAIPAGSTDAAPELSGEITVTNPNDFEPVTVSVTDVVDVGGDAVCTVDGGVDVVLAASGTQTFGYDCAFASTPNLEGTNTATVVWAGALFDGTVEATADVEFETDGETDLTVQVVDDQTNPDEPVTLGPATWNAAGTATTFTYTLTHEGVPGTCVDFTNTAWVVVSDGDNPSDDETVTICVVEPVIVTKAADASFDRTYLWDIEKSVDETSIVIGEDGTATFEYTVAAIPDGSTDSGWELTGDITVTNPNDFEAVTVSVTDTVDIGGGAVCTVNGGVNAVIAAGANSTFAYECLLTSEPDLAGTNTATVAWAGAGISGTATGTAAVEFELDDETDRTVEVFDDQTNPGERVRLGEATWNAAGTPTTFPYTATHEGVPGECVDFTNTAWIEVTDGEDPTDDQTVTVCVQEALTIVKTAEASFDRTYEWDIEKSADDTQVEIDENGQATFSYTVNAIPGDVSDSGWELSGSITVHNPNTYDEGAVTVTVTDVPGVGDGATCAVEDGEDITLAPGETRVFTYDCTLDGQPEYEGSNTATVTWTDAAGGTATAVATTDVTFALDGETDLTVEVYDDKVDLDEPALLGVATWNAAGTPIPFTYDLVHQGVGGECIELTNTAWVVVTGEDPSDDETVVLCVPSVLDLDKRTTSANQNADGSWTVTYDVVVTNPALFSGRYDLSDTLEYGAGITPTAASWALVGSTIAGTWDLAAGSTTVLATDVLIPGGASHTYTVTVTADVAAGVVSSEAGQCSGDEGTDGGGFLNAANLTAFEQDLTARDCAEPAGPTVAKTVGGLVENADGTWTVTYSVVVDNPSDEHDLYYDLSDSLGFAEGVSISSATVSRGATTYASWNGATETVIVTGQPLPAGATHTYAVSVTLSLSAAVSDDVRECGAGQGGPGNGLFNGVTLTSGNDEQDDDACVDIPDPELELAKTATGANQNADGSWTVTYDVVVSNPSSVGGSYDLSDTLEYGAGITPTAASWALAGTGATGTWDLVAGVTTELADGRAIAGGASHTYTVTVTADVAAGVVSSEAGQCSGDEGTDGGGFLNAATLSTSYDEPVTDRDCEQPAGPTVAKTVGGLVENADGTWTVTYSVVVDNPSDEHDLYYDLSDELGFAEGVTISSASVSRGATTYPAWNGGTETTVVTGEPLAAGATHTYAVSVTLSLSAAIADDVRECGAGQGGPGNGLFNGVTLTSGNDEQDDDACVDIPDPELELGKTATGANQNADGSWTVTYDVVVSNPSSVGGSYDLSDTLEYGAGITPTEATWELAGTEVEGEWDLDAGVTTQLADGRAITGGASHTYTVTVTADVAAGVVSSEAGQCSGDEGTDGGGFLNAATLSTSYDEPVTDRDCAEPSLPDLDKVFGSASQRPDATWDVTYTLVVDNSGSDATVYYTLEDAPGFPTGIEILDQRIFDVTGAVPAEIAWDGTAPIVEGMAILAGGVHRYEVTFHVEVPTSLPDEVAECDPAVGEGRGFFNSATLTSGPDEIEDEDCGEVVEVVAPDVAKSVADGYPVQGADGTWRIEYLITVTTPQTNPLVARYALEDTLDFGEGIEVLASTIEANDDDTPDPLESWTGLGNATAVTDGEILLPAGVTHTYRVRVVAELAATVVGTEAGECYTGEVRTAGGFLNVVELTSGDLVRIDDACAEPYDAPWTIEKTSDPVSGSQVEPGDTVTYTVTLRATGAGDPTGVRVVDDLSRVLNNAEITGPVTASIGGVVLEGDQLVWEVGTFSGTATLSYAIRVDDDAFEVTILNVVTGEGWTDPVCIGTCSTTHFTEGEGGDEPGVDVPVRPGLPITGADAIGLAALGMLLTLGGAVFLGERRRKDAHV